MAQAFAYNRKGDGEVGERCLSTDHSTTDNSHPVQLAVDSSHPVQFAVQNSNSVLLPLLNPFLPPNRLTD